MSAFGAKADIRIELYGNDRVSTQGVRVTHFENISVFNSRVVPFYISSGIQTVIHNLGIYPTSSSSGDLLITGGVTENTQSTDITVTGANLIGDLRINNCSQVYFQGNARNLILSPSAKQVVLDGTHSGVVNGSLRVQSENRMISP